MKSLLAATDLSAPARSAAERAALICQQSGAELDLVHVANLAPFERLLQMMGNSQEILQQQLLESAKQKLNELAAALHADYGVQPLVNVLQGGVVAELSAEADARQADLLVCGFRGESFLRRHLLGSTAERLLGRARSPLLVVKQPPHESYRRILIPVDFSPYSLRSIQQARRLAPGAAIVLLHAFEFAFESRLRYASVDNEIIEKYRIQAREDAENQMEKLILQAGLSPQTVVPLVLHGNAGLQILEQEQELACDLIVIGKRGDSLVEDFFLGSVTKYVLAESQNDVLVTL